MRKQMVYLGMVALLIPLVCCSERRAPLPDGAADGPASPDSAGGGDLSLDAAVNADLYAELLLNKPFANCTPVVPSDPLILLGHAEFLNQGTRTIGPIKFGVGRLLGATGEELHTFAVRGIVPFELKPGEGLSPHVEKLPGTLEPGGICGLCEDPLQVELAYSGAGIPPGARIVTGVVISCAH